MVFKYDIVKLIQLVESKPRLWDKTNENNKNKRLREQSWQEIFQCLDDEYEQLSSAQKKIRGETIMSKWCNIRDAFLRSLRTKNIGQGPKKTYVYGEHLNFLLKIIKKDDMEIKYSQQPAFYDSLDGNEDTTDSEVAIEFYPEPQEPTPSKRAIPSCSTQPARKVMKPNRDFDFVECDIFNEPMKPEQPNEPPPPKTDLENLMSSFLPYLRDMSESELMDFQMETLMIIKKIKTNRSSN